MSPNSPYETSCYYCLGLTLCYKFCKFKVTNAPVFSFSKDGKDDLAVAKVEFYMQQQDSNPSLTTKFVCEGFNITGDCKQVEHSATDSKPKVIFWDRILLVRNQMHPCHLSFFRIPDISHQSNWLSQAAQIWPLDFCR